ncbi:Uncharacterized protein Adt_18642 [Abeliophyllum distichum]|uniref:Uncharacterized protein n=1 Tax=Abeliophyllum distichum TaxID=126358 RepID=A0ABD1TJY0_9LAMI
MEEKNARCFKQGLINDLRQAIIVLELETYHEVLAKAQLADFKGRSSGKSKQQHGQVEKHKWEDNKGRERQDYAKKSKWNPTQCGDKSFRFAINARNITWGLVLWGRINHHPHTQFKLEIQSICFRYL